MNLYMTTLPGLIAAPAPHASLPVLRMPLIRMDIFWMAANASLMQPLKKEVPFLNILKVKWKTGFLDVTSVRKCVRGIVFLLRTKNPNLNHIPIFSIYPKRNEIG